MHATQRSPQGTPAATSALPKVSDEGKKRVPFVPKVDPQPTKKARRTSLDAASAADLKNQTVKLHSLFHQAIPSPNATFIVQGQRFEAHSRVLSNSPCAAFFAPLLKQDSPIEIKALSADAFKALLDHIYVGNLSLTPSTLLELYQFFCAHKFDASAAELQTHILKTIDWWMLSHVLQLAFKAVPKSPLFQSLLQLALRHSAYLWIGLDQLPYALFLEILKQETLVLESEHRLVKLISCWSQLHSEQDRQKMDACFQQVRFGLMSEKELAYLNEVEKLVSPSMWKNIQAKLDKKNTKEAFWQPRHKVSPDSTRFAFAAEPAEVRQKEDKRAVLSHGFVINPDERDKKLFITLQGSLCEFAFHWERQEQAQRYPFKLYLEKGGEELNSKRVYIWLQTQVQPNSPSLTVCQMQDLRKGLTFTSRYLSVLDRPLEMAQIRISALFLL